MTMKLDGAGAGAALAPADRHHARARQDRWELEIERALLASGQKSADGRDAGGAESAPREIREAPRPGPVAPREPVRDVGRSLRADGETATAAPQRPKAADAAPDETQEASAAGPAQRAPAAAAAMADRRVPFAAQQLRAGPASAIGAMAGTGRAWPGSATTRLVGMVGAPGAAAPATPAGAPPLAPATGLAVALPGTVAGVPAPERMVPDAQARALDEGAEGYPGTGAEGRARAERAADAYGLRNLHLQRHDGGIHAFIRDALLGGGQARAVAHAMAWELGRQGNVLSAVTINGRTFRPSGDDARRWEAPVLSGTGNEETVRRAVDGMKGVI